jgi:hypothetical protein
MPQFSTKIAVPTDYSTLVVKVGENPLNNLRPQQMELF